MSRPRLDAKLIDALRLEGIYSEPTYADYDVELYDRFYRKDVPFGTYRPWQPPRMSKESGGKIPHHKKAYTASGTYVTRLGGFSRKGVCGPDEIGLMLAKNGINYADVFMGYDPVESLMVCRKYGIRPYFYLPDCPSYLPGYAGVPLPFTKREIRAYRPKYRGEMWMFAQWLDKFGGMWGFDFKKAKDQIWILYNGIDLMPINLFEDAMKRAPDELAREFEQEHGFGLPLYRKLSTPRQKAERIRFWRWIRRKFEDVYRVRAEVFRKEFPNGILLGNFHWTTPVDYVRHADSVDVVGINTRPMMLDNDVGRAYETGYAVRLFADLCRKPIMSSPRANLLAVSPGGLVAGKKAIRYCYDQTIQNGVWGLYIFFEDFSAGRTEYDGDFSKVREALLGISAAKTGAYCGPGLGNPDPSTLPQERWRTLLDVSRRLARTKRFVPPRSKTGIFISMDTCSLGGDYWKRIFSAYVELTKAGVWANFISSDQVMARKERLGQFKLLFVPVVLFESRNVIRSLVRFVRDGGVLVGGDPRMFSYDENGDDATEYRRELFGVKRVVRRRTADPRLFIKEFRVRMFSYGRCGRLVLDDTASVLATYSDGSTAASAKKVGRGSAMLFGSPILDCYEHIRDGSADEDRGRSRFYKKLEQNLGIADQSWIWNVTVANLEKVTAIVPIAPVSPDRSIEFRDFLLQHKR